MKNRTEKLKELERNLTSAKRDLQEAAHNGGVGVTAKLANVEKAKANVLNLLREKHVK